AALHGAEEAAVEVLGDLIFAVVNIGRNVKADPEQAVRGTNMKFRRRSNHLTQVLEAEGETLEAATLERMEEIWQAA
ncbi:nucleoside triphosphate pyrophosphohydrolase, partial [Rhizobium ruizarguesonis]